MGGDDLRRPIRCPLLCFRQEMGIPAGNVAALVGEKLADLIKVELSRTGQEYRVMVSESMEWLEVLG